jgi:hypothetical protein
VVSLGYLLRFLRRHIAPILFPEAGEAPSDGA